MSFLERFTSFRSRDATLPSLRLVDGTLTLLLVLSRRSLALGPTTPTLFAILLPDFRGHVDA